MLFKLPSALKKKSPQSAVSKGTPHALLLPEVLERIFSFIEDDTLHDTVILVCRQWFYLNQRRVIRELSWNDFSKTNNTRRLDKLISHVPKATHLKWTLSDNNLVSKDAQKIFQALQGLNNNKNQTCAPSNGGLRAADLTGSDTILLKALPYLSSITLLRLCIVQRSSISMEYILQTCPNLHTLQLDSPSTFSLHGNWISANNNSDTVSLALPLRSLHLENASFAQSSLESLLEVTPRLKHLQLRNLRRQDSEENYNWSRLYKCLVSLALPLQSIHFSVFGQQAAEDAEEAREKVLMICPQSTEWSFRSSDLTPILKQCLQELPNVLTTLNLVTDSVTQSNKALALHQYLCESPHLLHLKAGQSSCLIERMDLFGRWMNLPKHGENAYRQPGIWMCRKLQTLHIEVHNLGSPAHQTSPIRTRVLFGYISRVCPNLRDLELWEPQNIPGFCLELDGGLCLLARLRLLEHLRIGSGKNLQAYKPRDLKWIAKSGHSRVSKLERKDIMRFWPRLLAKERQREQNRLDLVAEGVAPDFVAPQGVEPALVQDLQNLGLLVDVNLMQEQMNSNEGYESLPRLRSLSIYSGSQKCLSPEEEYRRVNVVASNQNQALGAIC
ncbi:MAG: hypothetical protein JOS17DRAFT_760857 [Linnemannia elongata]|nr:MAG: hypothetical protein JOS17DRAFT_760857 [Linnemannia elongata]